ncbi:MAG: hypothetical protein RLY86_1977 [Pseudomonadota bacterium]|jgi:uncharacterized protein YcbK (DUF882 family)
MCGAPTRRRFLVSGLALLGLSACGTAPEPPVAEMPVLPPLPDRRRLVLVHAQSGERVDAVYADAGRYIPAVLAQVNRLLRDRNTGEVAPIDPLVLDFLWDLLFRTGMPQGTEVHVTSGFRSAATNAKLVAQNRGAGRESFHLQGRALDFRVPLLPGPALAEIAKTMQRGGAAFYPTSGHTHIDVGPVRTWRTR